MFLRLILLILASGISIGTAFIQEITFYSELNSGGTSMSFTTKHGVLDPAIQTFIQAARSWCATGWWKAFDAQNFVAPDSFNVYNPTRHCQAGTFAAVQSFRHHGPSETSTSALSLYVGDAAIDPWSGPETVITTIAGVAPAGTTGALLTGSSSWSVWKTPDFSGTPTCLVPADEFTDVDFNADFTPPLVVAVVARGCDASAERIITLTGKRKAMQNF